MSLIVKVESAILQKAEHHRKSVGICCKVQISAKDIKKEKKRTDFVQDITNPKWDAELTFSNVDEYDLIDVKLKDKTSFGPVHNFGSTSIPVASFSPGSTSTHEYQLKKKKRPFGDNEFFGSIKLTITRPGKATGLSPSSNLGSLLGGSVTLSQPQLSSLRSEVLTSSGSDSSLRIKDRSPLKKMRVKIDQVPFKRDPSPKMKSSESYEISSSPPTSNSGSSSTSIDPFRTIGDLNSVFLRELFNLPDDEKFHGIVRCSYFSPILIHGSLYFSTNHICFFSRFLGKITQEVINLDNIFTVTKKITTSNIIVQTRSKSYNFLSFRGIDLYALILQSWKREGIKLEEFQDIDDIDISGMVSEGTWANDFWKTQDLEPIIQTDFPLSVPSFFKRFYDESFTRLFHERRTALEISIDQWTKNEQFGMIREISMRVPMQKFNITSSVVNITQKANLSKDQLVVLSTHVLRDIPFGDSLTVELKAELKQTSPKSCHLSIYQGINKTSKRVNTSQEGWLNKEYLDQATNWVALVRGELVRSQEAKKRLQKEKEQNAEAKPPPKESKFMKMVDRFPIFLIGFLNFGCMIALLWLWSYLSYVEQKANRLHCVLSPDTPCEYTVESLFNQEFQ